MGLAYLFISHNMAVVEHISHRIAVTVSSAASSSIPTKRYAIHQEALHPYTELLLLAVPVPDPRVKRQKRVLQGDVPSPINPPSGCPFPYALSTYVVTAAAPRRLPCARLNRGNGSHVTCASRPCSAPAGNRQSQRNPELRRLSFNFSSSIRRLASPARRRPFFSAASRRAPARCSPNIAKTIRPEGHVSGRQSPPVRKPDEN